MILKEFFLEKENISALMVFVREVHNYAFVVILQKMMKYSQKGKLHASSSG